ncbi:hypothetical protein Bbelb_243900 [Branchiostoma belcheri]|nr:hypothetical protein Bbelb_243900 [Branchiostoma belcheri]
MNRGKNNPMPHAEEPTSPRQNEDNLHSDQNVLHTENAAEPTRMSTCSQNSPSSQGQDRLEATYVAGNEVEHTSTNEDYLMADNNDIPTPEVADVYSVSDPIHAENSAMYTASGEGADDGDATGNSEEEMRVKQADSTVTMNFNSNRKANKSQPDTTVHAHKLCNPQINPADLHQNPMYRSNPKHANKRHGKPYAVRYIEEEPKPDSTVTDDGDIKPYAVRYSDKEPKPDSKATDDGDMEPYAVANMSDHMAYLSATKKVRQQASDESRNADSTVNDDCDMEPYAVANMSDHEAYLSATKNIRQQASDDTTGHDTTVHVHKLCNPPITLADLHQNPMYRSNPKHANKLPGKMAMQADSKVTGDGDMEPYAVADMSDHEAYLRGQQASKADSKATGDGDMEPYAVTDMWENEAYLTTTKKFANRLQMNPEMTKLNTYKSFAIQQTQTVKRLVMVTWNLMLLQTSMITKAVSVQQTTFANRLQMTPVVTPPNTHTSLAILQMQRNFIRIRCTYQTSNRPINFATMEEVKTLSTLNTTELIHIATIRSTDGTNPPSLGYINGTNPNCFGGINGTNPPNLGTTDGTNPPSLGGINGTNPPNLGTTDGTTAPSLGTTDGTTPPNLGTTDGTNLPTYKSKTKYTETFCQKDIDTWRPCAANELIVIDSSFYGRRENGPRCGCTRKSCDTCQDDANPIIKKYLEVTYHCEAEVKKNITFGLKGTRERAWVGRLAVSSTNEIFVTDEPDYTIKVFSMKGGFLRSFSLGNMEPSAVCMGNNDTLWVVLDRGSKFDIRQYSKEGHDLAKFTCSIKYKMVYGIAWHKLSDRIILTLAILGHRQDPVKVAWFSPTYKQESATCNVSTFGSEGGRFPQLVTVDQKGNIFVADHSNSRILKYDKNGVYLSSFGSKGRKPGNLYNPSGICVDSLGRVIVADTWNSQLEMFTAEGEHIHTIAYVQKPTHVATGGEGQLVVLNRYGFVKILVTIFPKY